MARRRRGRPLDGWIVLDKPAGMSSAQAVGAVKRLTRAVKAGHTGTLDPFATGVLAVALGEATKLSQIVMDGAKEYRFELRWGAETETGDTEGAVTATSDARPDADAIGATLPRFTGEIEQVPPAYSAIKVAGERAYALARAGGAPELDARRVRIFELRHEGCVSDRADAFVVRCGKGTYIRSLARDLARALGAAGHVATLQRTRVGPFAIEDAISLEMLETLVHSAADSAFVLPVETALDDIPALALTESEADRLRRGQPVPVLREANLATVRALDDGETLAAVSGERLVALTRLEGRQVHPVRVLNR